MLCNCFACSTCGGFEGTLTRVCPGIKVDDAYLDLVYKASLDYDGKRWINRPREEWEKPVDPAMSDVVDEAVRRLNWEQASRQLSQLFQEAPNIRSI
jgi:hypothetical protein